MLLARLAKANATSELIFALAATVLFGLVLAKSCDGSGSDHNDGSSVKPAQDAFGEEYDRRRGRKD